MAQTFQDEATKTCKCLNVRIRPQVELGKPPDFLITTSGDSEYTLTYVGEQGITVAHPQLTMRTKKMGPTIPGSPRCIRFTTLTCLLCQTLVYRVHQAVTLDIDGQEGPLLPSLDWVERETLRSSCGWIAVHKSCLVLDAAARLSSSPAYSPTFHVVVPTSPAEVPTMTAQPTPEASQDTSPTNKPVVGPFLDNLKPLFPPAPFVPSHPVFSHLSSIALRESESLRSAAEEYLAMIVRNKVMELEQAEDKLRKDVEGLWKKFVENLGQVEHEVAAGGEKKRRDSVHGITLNSSGVSGTPLVSVRNFVPVASPAARATSPASSLPRVSSLSASLATSAFHPPPSARGRSIPERSTSDSPRSPPPYSSHPSSLGSVDSHSLSTESLPGLSPRVNGETVIQPFKRSMDESRDTAVSFRYFTILEADVARLRQHEASGPPKPGPEDVANRTGEPATTSGGSKRAKVTSGAEKQNVKENEEVKEDPLKKSDRDSKPSEATPRGRRKVKFDIKSEPLATDGESAEKRHLPSSRKDGDGEEMIFDLEDGSSEPESSDAAPVLPFVDNVQLRRGRQRAASHTGLPASLSSLRPTSLPVYSPLRLKVGEVTTTKPQRKSHIGSSHPISPITPPEEAHAEYPEPLDPQEEEILRLVAANTPSHRGAWKRNSKAWQLFVSRQVGRTPNVLIPEENEDGNTTNDTDDSDWDTHETRWSHGHPASLPIAIGPLKRRREPLSLASYQPKTLSERTGNTATSQEGAVRYTSSVSLRRASYAERDRSRLTDPGALDFTTEDDVNGDESDSEDEPSEADLLDEGRGRQRALKILEARSRVPAEAMWRSLA